MKILLITPAQVNMLAFRGELEESYISHSAILVAQERYIRPAFSECYETLTSSAEPYPNFLTDYLQPALSQYIRYDILPSLIAQTGNSGIVQFGGTGNTKSATESSLNELMKATKRDAKVLLQRATNRGLKLKIIAEKHRMFI